MKKLIKFVTMFTIMAIFFASCGKDTIVPNPGPETGDHNVLWSYDMGVGNLSDITPAIDDNDNSYYSIANMETSKTVVFALDKDGNEIWKNELEGNSSYKVIYANSKVFVSTESPTIVYCINSSSGNVEWSKNLTVEYDFQWMATIAYANNSLYISSGQIGDGYLISYDINGTENWMKPTKLMGGTTNLSVSGNALYFNNGQSLYRYNDNGSSCDSIWEYNYGNKSNRSMISFYDLPIGDDGNIYIRDENIHIISPDGQLVRDINLDASYNEMYASNITLTSNNDILIGKGNLVMLSNQGNVEWETNISGIIVSPSFSAAATISNNGDFYDAQTFGLFCVKSNGNLNWSVTSENGGGVEHGNLHPPVLTHQGNIISVSSEQKIVRCFKGDGNGLATNGWPKPFGDYGNTNSK